MNSELIEVKIIGFNNGNDTLDGEEITITRNKNEIFINNGYATYNYYLSKISSLEIKAVIEGQE